MIAVDIRVPVGRPVPEVVDFVAGCERAGFHGVGIHDHHHSGRDVYVTLALAAAATARLVLYPATTNPVTRHPLVLAATANALTEVAPGRVLLTLAPGFLSVERAGEPRARRAYLGEVVTAVRRLLAGQVAAFEGHELRMNNTTTPPARVLVLASGPRMLELAGEVADGVLMLAGLDPQAVAVARSHVAAGARRAGRDPAALEEILIVPTAVAPFEEAQAWPRRWFRPGRPFLAYPSPANLHWLRVAGLDVPEDHRPEDLTPALAARVCDALGLFGPAEHCAERLLRARAETGAEHVFLFPAHTEATGYDLPVAEVAAFRDVIGPRLAAAG
ncbi:LLM class flavin-dependent oxidoreductase [Georgenia thermotolerans]|uniref:LLM class flavin-dependent oxidoreductase n=1 Tax=Georgenia thermotolerans TaxID=527326 RepID=UPI001478F0E7|nr:LLM class flavin-dependent oxidoreductase [Georgenia thermotolerans]